MKTLVKRTKNNIYAKQGEKDFFLINWEKRTFLPMTDQEKEQKPAWKLSNGWREYPENDLKEVFNMLEREIQLDRENRQNANQRKAEKEEAAFQELLKLEPIPTSVKNLYIVMQHLSKHNWGSWNLPKMSIGYSANQYDCDGTTAVTVILDQALKGCKKFQYNAPRGHLSHYQNIGRF